MTTARIELHDTGIYLYDQDGKDPSGAYYVAAREAVDEAERVTGADACHPSDGDVYLDTQSSGEGYDRAVGIILGHITRCGFRCLVVATEDCRACEGKPTEEASKCPGCGGRGLVEVTQRDNT
jgi:hypothetical protein